MDTPRRRALVFHTLDEAARDAESLLQSGYDQTGNWNLSQTCRHLIDWMRFPLDGFPRSGLPMRTIFFVVRSVIGPRMLQKTLASGSMPAGTPTIPSTIYEPGSDDADAVARFGEVVERFQSHRGRFHPSPVFGTLDAATATRLQCIHCAHHLSFLVPRDRERPHSS